jgi:hypothetical protein
MPQGRKKENASKAAARPVTWNGRKYRVNALAAQGLKQLETAFDQYQSTRARSAVYGYLTAVYEFAVGFKTAVGCRRVAKQMAKQKGYVVREDQDRFSLLIRATSTVNEKTRWKWTICLLCAVPLEVDPLELEGFIRELGGINQCVAQCLGSSVADEAA